ncbi:helix-turn-helix domain-containing protein [Streptomyces sp. NPDC056930]|uniref:helix-turn-helix domain-containing protein n=1 Tax=Streptomyces sp. NPDC056930 TaxID=3345967 RepID=UPI003634A35C
MKRDTGTGLRRPAGLPRALVVRRLLERHQAGELTSQHVRAVADVSGVSVRTVWRWLERAKATGQAEAGVRQGYAVSDMAWALLGRVGGNVAELRRRLADGGDGGEVPSLSTLHRVVRRDRRAGRTLVIEREIEVAGERRPDDLLSELGLNVVAGRGAGRQVYPPRPPTAAGPALAPASCPDAIRYIGATRLGPLDPITNRPRRFCGPAPSPLG